MADPVATLTDAMRTRLPWQMKRGDWGAVTTLVGALADSAADRLRQAAKAARVLRSPADALGRLGVDRILPRYPSEGTEQYRARLAAAWESWDAAGTARSVVAALVALGFPVVRVYNIHAAPDWWVGSWPPPPPRWNLEPSWWASYAADEGISTAWPPAAGTDAAELSGRCWVELAEPFAWPWTRVPWGTAAWGSFTWGGTTATSAQVRLVRAVIRKWIPAHLVCQSIFVRFESGAVVTWPGA